MARKLNRVPVIALLVVFVTLAIANRETTAQGGDGEVTLTVRLRAADGEPVTDEWVVLQRLPDEDVVLPSCRTDSTGACAWSVARGLYQVLFERPLDGVSALALAEGGLRGFGLTVGDEAITYHFTLQEDGRVYFDAVPEAARPVPIIPTPELLLGGVAPTATPVVVATEGLDLLTAQEAGEPDAVAGGDDRDAPAGWTSWRFVLYLALGLTAGGGLHLYSRCRQQQATGKEEKDA